MEKQVGNVGRPRDMEVRGIKMVFPILCRNENPCLMSQAQTFLMESK